MEKINAVITGVGGYVPEYVLNNDELSRMVDTNDEWIMTRIGIKERRILNEEGLGARKDRHRPAGSGLLDCGDNHARLSLSHYLQHCCWAFGNEKCIYL